MKPNLRLHLFPSAVDMFDYKLPYKYIFGGVSAMRVDHFVKTNGFSNRYWGWGGEDDDIYKRLKEKRLGPMHLSEKHGKYMVTKGYKL